MKLCECGCLMECKNRFVKGHYFNALITGRIECPSEKLMRICPNPNNNENCLKTMLYKLPASKSAADARGVQCESCKNGGMDCSKVNLCHCGCDRILKCKKSHFVPGHQNKGKNNPRFGISPSNSTRKLMSDGQKRSYAEGIRVPTPPDYRNMGINGSFRGMKFESSCELNFLLCRLDFTSLVRANTKQFRITYKNSDGECHLYIPDYFDISNSILYEIKMVGYEKDLDIKKDIEEKKPYAIDYCNSKSWTYELLEILSLDKLRVIFPMRERGEITLTPKWEKQYQFWVSERAIRFGVDNVFA